jgi:oxygen-dependent protoporphyrinogen oxidase
MRDAVEVAVVGSGPSGLAAGFRLQQAGFRVRLFEAEGYVGGKMRTVRRDGFVIDEGAGILTSGYRQMLAIAHTAGLGDEIVGGGSVFGFARGDRVHELDAEHLLRSAARFGLLSGRSKRAMVKLVADVARFRAKLDFEDLSLAADWDTESAGDYARRRLGEESHEYVVDATVRGLVGSDADRVSKLDFLFSFAKFIGVKLVAFRDGMGSYADHLARRFDVEVGAPVVAVEERGGEVAVTWRPSGGDERTDRFAGCVLAVPAGAAARLRPDLDSDRAEFLRGVRYTTIVNVSVALSRAPAGVRASVINVPRSVHPGLVVVTVDHHKAPGRAPAGKGLLGLYTHTDWAEELFDQDDDLVTKQLIEAGEWVIPGFGADVEFATVSRWRPMVPESCPGHYRRLAAFNVIRRQQDQLIQLAGDYFSCPNVNSATAAGERAARDLITALSQASA